MSKFYFVTNYSVTNPEGYAEYPKRVAATQEGLGKRLIAGQGEVIEGNPGDRLVVLEFGTREQYETWYNSPEYQAILPLRVDNTEGFAILIEGYSE